MSYHIQRSLLVEDNMIIAMDGEEMLLDLGAESVKICSTVEESIRYLANNAVDFALLDINLGSETSEATAALLAEKGIPFLFATGHAEAPTLTAKHPAAPLIQKPYSAASIADALQALNIPKV